MSRRLNRRGTATDAAASLQKTARPNFFEQLRACNPHLRPVDILALWLLSGPTCRGP